MTRCNCEVMHATIMLAWLRSSSPLVLDFQSELELQKLVTRRVRKHNV